LQDQYAAWLSSSITTIITTITTITTNLSGAKESNLDSIQQQNTKTETNTRKKMKSVWKYLLRRTTCSTNFEGVDSKCTSKQDEIGQVKELRQGQGQDKIVEENRVEENRVEENRVEENRVEENRVEENRVEENRVEEKLVEIGQEVKEAIVIADINKDNAVFGSIILPNQSCLQDKEPVQQQPVIIEDTGGKTNTEKRDNIIKTDKDLVQELLELQNLRKSELLQSAKILEFRGSLAKCFCTPAPYLTCFNNNDDEKKYIYKKCHVTTAPKWHANDEIPYATTAPYIYECESGINGDDLMLGNNERLHTNLIIVYSNQNTQEKGVAVFDYREQESLAYLLASSDLLLLKDIIEFIYEAYLPADAWVGQYAAHNLIPSSNDVSSLIEKHYNLIHIDARANLDSNYTIIFLHIMQFIYEFYEFTYSNLTYPIIEPIPNTNNTAAAPICCSQPYILSLEEKYASSATPPPPTTTTTTMSTLDDIHRTLLTHRGESLLNIIIDKELLENVLWVMHIPGQIVQIVKVHGKGVVDTIAYQLRKRAVTRFTDIGLTEGHFATIYRTPRLTCLSSKNNRQIRRDPKCPTLKISPWMNSCKLDVGAEDVLMDRMIRKVYRRMKHDKGIDIGIDPLIYKGSQGHLL
jgi:hypothetical protein